MGHESGQESVTVFNITDTKLCRSIFNILKQHMDNFAARLPFSFSELRYLSTWNSTPENSRRISSTFDELNEMGKAR